MKRLIFCSIWALLTLGVQAQETTTGERSEWLPTFDAIRVSAAVDLKLVKIADDQAPRIVFDTKGSYTTKFQAEVKNKSLYITEKVDTRRAERTSVTVYYNQIQLLSATDATVSFEGTFSAPQFDLIVAARSSVTATFDVKDLVVEQSGKSTAQLTGKARYFSLALSTGTTDAAKLETMSAVVTTASSGHATVWATERFEGHTTTGGSINYKGSPIIIRTGTKLMGGAISHIE